MRRFISPFLLIASVVVVLGFYPLLAPTPHRIDQAHFELIKQGMAKADVEAIFGVPSGEYDWAESESHAHLVRALAAIRLEEAKILERAAAAEHTADLRRRLLAEARAFYLVAEVSETWVSRHGAFTVQFDENNRVDSTNGGHGVRIVPPWQRWWRQFRNR